MIINGGRFRENNNMHSHTNLLLFDKKTIFLVKEILYMCISVKKS